MSGTHRIEVSPNNRAGCKNTECKREGIKIQKGQIRYGTYITGPDWQSWAWKHWGCVTPKQISNLKESIEGDPSQLDGYEELPEDFQEKVVSALEQGHIDDEDWGWDPEMNRDGKNGYFTLEHKRQLKVEAQLKALKEGNAGEGSASPKKADTKKRGHVKDDPDAEGAAEDEPPAKKTKARTKKEMKIKNEDSDRGSENEGPKVKKSKPRVKKEPKIKDEDAEIKSENEEPTNRKTKAAVKKGKKADGDETDEDFERAAEPVKKGRKRAKKATAEDDAALDIKDESNDRDTLHASKGKEPRAPRKAATAKQIKDEDTETDDLDSATEHETPLGNTKPKQTSDFEPEASEDAPKLQKGGKRASKKVVNGTAGKAKKESKSKANPGAPRSNGRATRSHPS